MQTTIHSYRTPHAPLFPPLATSDRAPRRAPFISSSRPAVLIVEESEEMREHFEAFLSDEYQLALHANVREALIAAQSHTFDLVLIDIDHNKEVEAISMLNQFRRIESCKEVPVVAMTGYMLPEGKAVLKRGKFSTYLAKPFTLRQLKQTIRRCIVKRTVMILNRL